jgi:hypothetical protein
VLSACSDENDEPERLDSGATDDTHEAGTEPGPTSDESTSPDDSEPSADAGGSTDEPSTAEDGGIDLPDASASDAGTVDAAPPTDAAPADAAADAGSDPEDDAAVADAGGDAGQEPEDVWAACPAAEDYVGDPESGLTLQVSEEAVYCATFQETRTLKEELAAKAQLRFTPGSYQLDTTGTLPLCVRPGAGAAVPASSGSTSYSVSVSGGEASHSLVASHVFDALDGAGLNVRLDTTVSEGSPAVFELDGTENSFDDFSEYRSFEMCSEAGEECFPDRIFDSCSWDSGVLNLHEVTFEGGHVAFELRLGDSFAGTEPGAFVRASGEFLGQSFEQTDYFKLIYHPTHHHFQRTFAVLFDQAIDGVCGLQVGELEPFGGDDVADEAFTVDCELNQLQTLSVESHTLTQPE